MDISRLNLTRSLSSSASVGSSVNLKSHHNISKEQPHRTFSLITQNHQQHSSSATTSTNTNSVMMISLNSTTSSLGNSKKKSHKFGKDSYLDDNDDWLANVGEYTIEKEDKFIKSFAGVQESNFFVGDASEVVGGSDAASSDKDIDDKYSSSTIKTDSENRLLAKYERILHGTPNVKLNELRDVSWHGIPLKYKALSWKLLLGYLPSNSKRHKQILMQKRQSYKNGIAQSIRVNSESGDMGIIQLNENNKQTWHQIDIDLKRTHPDIPLYQFSSVKKSLQRILYYWAIRRPTTGYVQGINDICTTFFQVFLLDYFNKNHKDRNLNWDDIESTDPTEYMDAEDFNSLESDTFWCFDRFLESIMDNYIHGQPGILRQVSKLETICKRIDPILYNHFANEQVEFFQFAFRWMNCLLMREVPMRVVLRMWDTYLAESSSDITSTTADADDVVIVDAGKDADNDSEYTSSPVTTMRNNSIFNSELLNNSYQNAAPRSSALIKKPSSTRLNDFHVYVCCAFLEKWATTLESMDFTGIIMFLQSCPTTSWNEQDIEMLLSEAYLWQCHFKDSL